MLRNKITRSGANTIGGGGYVDDVFSTYVYDATRIGGIQEETGQKITNGINLLSNTGKSLQISASNYISYGRIPAADFGTNNWTMEMFLRCSSLYTSSAGQIVNLIMKDDVSTRSFQWRWYQNKFEFLYWNTSGILSIVNFGTYGSFPLNQWLHVRLCKSGSTLYMYVDGTRIGTASITNIRSGSDPLTVGCYLGGGSGDKSYNIGYVSNVRIVNGSALSTGTSFTVPTTPLTKVNNTSLLMAQYPDPFLDSSNNKYAISDGNSLLGSLNPPITLPTDDVPLGEGLVWIKNRDKPDRHKLVDTVRGANKEIESDTVDIETLNPNGLTAFHADGFSVGGDDEYHSNSEGYVSWTFKKQPGFFDIVTWTGDSVNGRAIPHNLGSVPGCFIVKRRNGGVGTWEVYHRKSNVSPEDYHLQLDSTNAAISTGTQWAGTAPTDTHFTVSSGTDVNFLGSEYVAYLFAHDDQRFGPNGDESIIQCGSYTGNGLADGPVIDLGWEPQWLLIKKADDVGGFNTSWMLLDNIRGLNAANVDDAVLVPNTDDEENFDGSTSLVSDLIGVQPRGFQVTNVNGRFNQSGSTYIYIAIRRPHKPASEFDATDLFDIKTASGSPRPMFKSGFPVDFALYRDIDETTSLSFASARFIEGNSLRTSSGTTMATDTDFRFYYSDGWHSSTTTDSTLYSWMWRRAPEFFDMTCWRGDGAVDRVIPHNLGVVPEMIWVKCTSNSAAWAVYSKTPGASFYLLLDEDAIPSSLLNLWEATTPTATGFTVSSSSLVNGSARQYIACLFASVPGLCDIGSYTGNGTSQTIDCGFTGGARFVLTKRTDDLGNWSYWDTARGIVAGADSRLALNDNNAEDTGDDAIDPDSSGFIVSDAGNTKESPNISGATYIYMAIA